MFVLCFVLCCVTAVTGDPVLLTSTGKLHGFRKTVENGLISEVYTSVPFVRPPIGDLRFAKPKPYEDPDADVDATRKHPACPQNDLSVSKEIYINFTWQSEDCLFLNIYKPVTNLTNLPIVFYIFGGSFVSGSANLFMFNGEKFVTETNTIYVVVNYRVGMFGFLNIGTEAAPGNQGVWDTLEGLRWVKKNARALGGNPDDITVWGQSAGAVTAGILMTSPLSKDLFHRAIFQSGATSTAAVLLKQNTPSMTQKFFEKLGCMNEADDWEENKAKALNCVKAKEVKTILKLIKAEGFSADLIAWQPIIGDELIPVHPFATTLQPLHSVKQLFITTTSSEGTAFVEVMNARSEGVLSEIGDTHTLLAILTRTILHTPIRAASKVAAEYLGDRDEPTGIELKRFIAQFLGDIIFYCPVEYFAAAAKNNGIQVYRGSFEQRPSYSPWPEYSNTAHCDDVPLTQGQAIGLYENPERPIALPGSILSAPITPAEVQWTHDTIRILGDFIRHG